MDHLERRLLNNSDGTCQQMVNLYGGSGSAPHLLNRTRARVLLTSHLVRAVHHGPEMRATSDAQSLPNLEIQDVEAWPNEFSIDMPTAAEMAERGKTIAEAPWPSIERVVEPCEVRGVEDRLANIFKP